MSDIEVQTNERSPVRYVTYDTDGNLTGCYLQTPLPEHADHMIPVGEEHASDWVNYRADSLRMAVEPIPAPTPDPMAIERATVAAYETQVDKHLDGVAWLYGYNSIISAISYADEPAVPAFQTEGQAFRAWRSLVWAKCREILAAYQAGERAAPTAEELLDELPALDLPAPTLGRTVQDQ